MIKLNAREGAAEQNGSAWRGKALSAGIALSVLGGLGGCEIMNDTYVIETNPTGATVTFSNGDTCTTPCELTPWPTGPLEARITRVGYRTMTASIKPGPSGRVQPNPLRVELNLVAPTVPVETAPLAPAQDARN